MSTAATGTKTTYSQVEVGQALLRNGRYLSVVAVDHTATASRVRVQVGFNKTKLVFAEADAVAYVK